MRKKTSRLFLSLQFVQQNPKQVIQINGRLINYCCFSIQGLKNLFFFFLNQIYVIVKIFTYQQFSPQVLLPQNNLEFYLFNTCTCIFFFYRNRHYSRNRTPSATFFVVQCPQNTPVINNLFYSQNYYQSCAVMDEFAAHITAM